MTKAKAKAKMGRPSIFNQQIADAICGRLAEGESLRAICASPDMPCKATVFVWLASNEEFRAQYNIAREMQSDGNVDEIVYIADTEPDPNKARVMIDARKWVAGKMRPKVYGDKVTTVHSDPDGKPINAGPTIIFAGAPAGASAPEAVGGAPKRGD